ncbi:chaperone NapD [Vibrio sp. WXL103]|uniref:chaperone NapD n=1 Tax=unclassified Vibrio TaxID=2614977 RepID=UPI003EC7111C
MQLNEVHISSLVVHCEPLHLAVVKAQIEELDGAEVYGDSPAGKIVVVLETDSQGFITETIDTISHLPNVLSTVLVYHQIDADGQIDTDRAEQPNEDTGIEHSQIEGEA